MKTFTINEKISVFCRSEKTRSGFRHLATLSYGGYEAETVKCIYYNRTWESYEFQTVLRKVAEKSKTLSSEEKDLVLAFAADGRDKEDDSLGVLGAIMALGDLFGSNQTESNDWKERMLKTGLEGRGLLMPEDWDSLSEEEKETRLNGVVGVLVK